MIHKPIKAQSMEPTDASVVTWYETRECYGLTIELMYYIGRNVFYDDSDESATIKISWKTLPSLPSLINISNKMHIDK